MADMLDVFDVALDYINENRFAWTDDLRTKAIEGIHWQIVNSARVALNATRTHARRQKFCEESASWPDGRERRGSAVRRCVWRGIPA